MAALVAGADPPDVAREHAVPLTTVRTWARDLRRENLINGSEKRAELGALVADYLAESLVTLTAHARFARDEDWLRKQNASDVAVLHGVLNDKIVRLLAAMQPADNPARDDA